VDYKLDAYIPTIVSQPSMKPDGALSVSGSVVYGTFGYQWYKNGVALAGGTGQSAEIPFSAGLSSGTYTVKLSNSFGSVSSAGVNFDRNVALRPYIPTIVSQPSMTPDGALSVSGSVVYGTFGYQWYKNGVAVAGGTGQSAEIAFYAGLSSGTYAVKLSNSFGSVVSNSVKFDRTKFSMFASVLGGTLPGDSELSGQVVSNFQIGKTEVTWGEWKTVREWAATHGYSDLADVGAGSVDPYPVINVSWYDVVKWCNAKSEKEGKTPVYQVSGVTYKSGESDPTVKTSANGYRLPTELEWEWAARGGRQTHGYTYSGSNDLNAVGWYSDNSSGASHEVGTKAANELGIFDMTGNVWEWCWDLYSSDFVYRRLRGGSWDDDASSATVSFRGYIGNPGYRDVSTGFRLACSSGQ